MEYVSPDIRRQIFSWRSPRLGLEMPIVRYGHWGRPLLLLPSAAADFLEYERFFVIKSMERYIREGKVTVFSINSVNRHCWMDDSIPVHEKVRRQGLYAGYIEEEVVPAIRQSLQDPGARPAVSGVSFGAFHATNEFFRRPDLFSTLIAVSGFFDLAGYLEGQGGGDAYFHNPTWYVPNLGGAHLDTVKNHCRVHLVTGRGQWERPEKTERFSQLLWDKGIWHDKDMWGHDVAHDWPWWRRMYDHYLDHKLGW